MRELAGRIFHPCPTLCILDSILLTPLSVLASTVAACRSDPSRSTPSDDRPGRQSYAGT